MSAAAAEEVVDATVPEELPCMEDRKLFLGILTCIVASSYDYDLTVEGGTGESSSTTAASSNSNSNSGGSSSFLSKFLEVSNTSQSNLTIHEDVSMFLDESEDGGSAGAAGLGDGNDEKTAKKEEDEDETSKRARAAKIQQKMKLAEERYLVRRYQVALDFIKSSAQHLLLPATDETLQKEFLPLLDDLLEVSKTTTYNVEATNTNTSGKAAADAALTNPEQHAAQKAKEIKATGGGVYQLDWVQDNPQLQNYLQQLSGGTTAAYKCLCWLLFQHLLHTAKEVGYDARVRYWFKTLAVTLWMQRMEMQHKMEQEEEPPLSSTKLARATRKFESLEHAIATRLLTLAAAAGEKSNTTQQAAEKRKSSTASNIWKGVQVGGVGVLAGTLLAVTGGLAAPGIYAGLAAMGLGAIGGTFITLASSTAVLSIFGVATGGLAAYKMSRRVSGLTEFTIQQELIDHSANDNDEQKNDKKKTEPPLPPQKAELFRTIGISGWLNTGKSDFSKPWGANPPIEDKVEALQRFYHIHNPDMVPQAESTWKQYQEKPEQLWKFLRDKYGTDPDHIFDVEPYKEKPPEYTITSEEETTLDAIIVAIGNVEEGGDNKNKQAKPTNKKSTSEPKTKAGKESDTSKEGTTEGSSSKEKKNQFSMKGLKKSILTKTANAMTNNDDTNASKNTASDVKQSTVSLARATGGNSDFAFEQGVQENKGKPFEPPAHLSTVWDYKHLYGGELYTVRWESDLLIELCNSVRDLAVELASKGGQQVLKYTVASTLMLAAALPMTIAGAMGSIDGTWTLVIDRADEAGKELARSLLVNNAGHRPVTLVGYSFGARVIFSCLKELARLQQKWEEYQIQKKEGKADKKKAHKRDKKQDQDLDELEFDREPASIVEDAILMGMPKYLNLSVWKAIRQVVAGRLVNVYSRQDKILSFMFKYKRILGSIKPVVGTCTVAVPGVENIDVTDMVAYHQDYVALTGDILKRVRHGQPERSSSNAMDEEALIKEAEEIAKKEGAAVQEVQSETADVPESEDNELLRGWK